jgi:uncharacterized protein YgiM (DUF1202 family)
MMAGAVLIAGLAGAANTVYVQSIKSNIYAQPSFSSRVIAVAEKGEALDRVGAQGNWYRISRSGTSGWLLKHTVSDRKPAEKVSFFSSVFDFFRGKSERRRPSSVVSTAGVRGLTADEKAGMDQNVVAAYEALDRMEEVVVTDDELRTFQQAR